MTTNAKIEEAVATTPSGAPVVSNEDKIRANLYMIETGISNLYALNAVHRLSELPLVVEVHGMKDESPVTTVKDTVVNVASDVKHFTLDAGYATKHAVKAAGNGIVNGATAVKERTGNLLSSISNTFKSAAAAERPVKPAATPPPTP